VPRGNTPRIPLTEIRELALICREQGVSIEWNGIKVTLAPEGQRARPASLQALFQPKPEPTTTPRSTEKPTERITVNGREVDESTLFFSGGN